MATASKYPTLAEAEATFANDEEILDAVKNLPTYRQTVSVLTIGEEMEMNPDFLRAVADFAAIVSDQTGHKITLDGRSFQRQKNGKELREAAIEDRRTKMYYHPEEYGLEAKGE